MSLVTERDGIAGCPPQEAALVQKALAYWRQPVDPVDRVVARDLFVRGKTSPRRDRRNLVSNRTVTPWDAKAYASYMVEEGIFTQAQAFGFMSTACLHYVGYLKWQRECSRQLVLEEDIEGYRKLGDGFTELAFQTNSYLQALAVGLALSRYSTIV